MSEDKETKIVLEEPRPVCKLYIEQSMGELKLLISDCVNKISNSVGKLEQSMQGVKKESSELARIIRGNGIIGHAELVRTVNNHLNDHKTTRVQVAGVIGKVLAGIILTTWNLFLGYILLTNSDVKAKASNPPSPPALVQQQK